MLLKITCLCNAQVDVHEKYAFYSNSWCQPISSAFNIEKPFSFLILHFSNVYQMCREIKSVTTNSQSNNVILNRHLQTICYFKPFEKKLFANKKDLNENTYQTKH